MTWREITKNRSTLSVSASCDNAFRATWGIANLSNKILVCAWSTLLMLARLELWSVISFSVSVRALDGNQVVDEALPIYFMSVGNIDHAIYHLNLSMTDKRRQDLFKIIGCDATVIYGKSSVCSQIIKEGLVWLSLSCWISVRSEGERSIVSHRPYHYVFLTHSYPQRSVSSPVACWCRKDQQWQFLTLCSSLYVSTSEPMRVTTCLPHELGCSGVFL